MGGGKKTCGGGEVTEKKIMQRRNEEKEFLKEGPVHYLTVPRASSFHENIHKGKASEYLCYHSSLIIIIKKNQQLLSLRIILLFRG